MEEKKALQPIEAIAKIKEFAITLGYMVTCFYSEGKYIKIELNIPTDFQARYYQQ